MKIKKKKNKGDSNKNKFLTEIQYDVRWFFDEDGMGWAPSKEIYSKKMREIQEIQQRKLQKIRDKMTAAQ
jgi:hypothetical protein